MSQRKSSKLPSEYTLEELLESINNNTNTTKDSTTEEHTQTLLELVDNDVYEFILSLNLKSGPNRIKKRIMYAIYKAWSVKPVGLYKFSVFFQSVFDHDNTHYLLNSDVLSMLRTPVKYIKRELKGHERSRNYKQHFETYLNHYGMEAGKFYIQGYVLYYLYDLWTYKNKSLRPLNYKNFIKFCDIYFERKRLESSKIYYYGINESIKETHLTKDRLDEIHQWGRKYNEKKSSQKFKKQKDNKRPN